MNGPRLLVSAWVAAAAGAATLVLTGCGAAAEPAAPTPTVTVAPQPPVSEDVLVELRGKHYGPERADDVEVAEGLARQWGVERGEAQRRLEAQYGFVPLAGFLREKAPAAYGGSWIDDESGLIHLALVGPSAQAIEDILRTVFTAPDLLRFETRTNPAQALTDEAGRIKVHAFAVADRFGIDDSQLTVGVDEVTASVLVRYVETSNEEFDADLRTFAAGTRLQIRPEQLPQS